jgi:hypothetical protein
LIRLDGRILRVTTASAFVLEIIAAAIAFVVRERVARIVHSLAVGLIQHCLQPRNSKLVVCS